MKLRILTVMFTLSVIVFTFAQSAFPQDQFEGKVTINVYDDGKAHTVDYFVKGSKIRFDAAEDGHQGQVIMDPVNKQFLIIMPEQKMYMITHLPDIKPNTEASGETGDDANFSKTGETKEIMGLTAEKWTFKDGDDQGEAWMTKQIGAFKLFDNPMQENRPQWQKDIVNEGYFPLEVSENGKKVYEVTNIEKKSLDQSMFEVPAGYQKMDIPNLQQ